MKLINKIGLYMFTLNEPRKINKKINKIDKFKPRFNLLKTNK